MCIALCGTLGKVEEGKGGREEVVTVQREAECQITIVPPENDDQRKGYTNIFCMFRTSPVFIAS
jgi:hypothetical protein